MLVAAIGHALPALLLFGCSRPDSSPRTDGSASGAAARSTAPPVRSAVAGVGAVPVDAGTPNPDRLVEIARRPLRSGWLALALDGAGGGHLLRIDPEGHRTEVPCEPLAGAWGLWLDDVDLDGHAEALVALRKPARYDPVVENRLHVYAFEAGRCVPLWRGTRLAGRFEDLAVDAATRGELLAWERAGGEHRVARYRWTGFGYAVVAVPWSGPGDPPARYRERFASLGGQRCAETSCAAP
ncbi:MAG: hypothetical protein HY905_15420 [Deltaproteobacteria bacterium]|nr:hypothetical protein [Deltaproteobacteria bacterium]